MAETVNQFKHRVDKYWGKMILYTITIHWATCIKTYTGTGADSEFK